MSERHEVHLLALCHQQPSDDEIQALNKFCASVNFFVYPKIKRLWHLPWNILKGLPIHVGYFYDSATDLIIQNYLDELKVDLIMCQLVRMAPYVDHRSEPKWIDFMDSFSANLSRRINAGHFFEKIWLKWENKRMMKAEKSALQQFDMKSIISDQDRESIDPEDLLNIEILPNGVDTLYFQPNVAFQKRYDIVFVGNLGYEPNIKAVRFILDQLVPVLSDDIDWGIAGDRPSQSLLNHRSKNVKIKGWVDDIREVYLSGRIFVAPLMTGSGQQNKILEAMACGIPVITTTLVNNAIKATPDQEILIADDAETFIAKIKQLLNDDDLQLELAKNGRRYVEDHYTWKIAGQKLLSFIEKI